MSDYAITNRLTPFISMQNFHNAAYREEEREMMPTLQVSCRIWDKESKLMTRCTEWDVFPGHPWLEGS